MTNNSLAFIALCNEYCAALENPQAESTVDFAMQMLRLLPRIYISAADLEPEPGIGDTYIDQALDEDFYDSVRRRLEQIFGEDDTYLEVFEEDMKYSDTPIAASIAEGLADLFQVFYNMLDAVRDAPEHLANDILAAVKDDFSDYWSQILCNLMRPLNHLAHNS